MTINFQKMLMLFMKTKNDYLPLIGLLTVQLMTGIMLIPLNNFGGIYLNEVLAYPIRQVAFVNCSGAGHGHDCLCLEW